VYHYLYPFQPRSLAVFAIVYACCAVLALIAPAQAGRREWLLVATWLVAGLLSQAVIRQLTPFSLEQMFVSDGSNGFYTAARQYHPAELLSNFDRLRVTFESVHARGNMPGKTLLAYGLGLLSSRPAVQAWLVVVLSNAGGVLLYLFVRDYLGDRDTALVALIFYLFVPAKLVFFPVLNTISPVLVLGCAWLWLRLLQSRAIAYALALGVSVYVTVFYEPTLAVMGVLFLLLTAHAWLRAEVDWRTGMRLTGFAILGFAAIYAVVVAWLGFDLLTTLREIGRDAVAFNARTNRPYGAWVVRNPIDFLFGVGVSQAALFCGSVAYACFHATRVRRAASKPAALTLGIAAALVAADLVGVNRGEVIRLWIFLACFAQIPAAYVVAQLDNRGALILAIGATLLQDVLSTSMLAFASP